MCDCIHFTTSFRVKRNGALEFLFTHQTLEKFCIAFQGVPEIGLFTVQTTGRGYWQLKKQKKQYDSIHVVNMQLYARGVLPERVSEPYVYVL